MKRVYAVIELADESTLDPSSDADLDAFAEDLLCVAHRVKTATVYTSAEDLMLINDSGVRPALRPQIALRGRLAPSTGAAQPEVRTS